MFSIIMPVWNRAQLVSNAIESVLAQTFKDYELIIIDDGSEDNLAEVVQPYLSDKIIFHRITKKGVSAARNVGLTKAKHPFIAYLDSDNRWHSEYLETMHNALNGASTNYAAAYCLVQIFSKNQPTGEMSPNGRIGAPFSFKRLAAGNYIDINAFVHTRKILDYTGIFDNDLKRLGDWDLILRITSLVEPVFVPKVLVKYYSDIAENTISNTELLEPATNIIHSKYTGFKKPFVFTHDTTQYSWDDLSEKKFRNFWVRFNRQNLNTSEYTAWGYPFMLQIEPTNACNLECPLCPVGRKELGRKTEHMSFESFKSVIDDMEDYLLFLVMWGWGEPFMNPQLPWMIQYASVRNIRTVTSTNAHFLDNESYLTEIMSSGLTTLIVAIDSVHDEKYSLYRKKGNLNKALAGLEKVVEIKKRLGSKTLINLRMVVMKQNEHEFSSLRKLARNIGTDLFTVKSLNPSCGSVNMDSDLVPDNLKYRRFEYDPNTGQRIRIQQNCTRPWDMATIHSNGNVVPCSYDYNSTMTVGNINEKPFSEIWNSQAFRQLRKRIYTEKDLIEKCHNCWINFKLSDSGWFPYNINFNDTYFNRLKDRAKGRFGNTMAWKILRESKRVLSKSFY